MHKKLFIPGPIDVKEDILEKMSSPQISHRSKEASNLQRDIEGKVQKLFYTKNTIILSTSSGSGLMEGAIRSCTKKRAVIFSAGAFGERWFKIAQENGVASDIIRFDLGSPVTVDLVDKTLATGKYDVLTLTHNETSVGLMNPIEDISKLLKAKYPHILFLVDSVSSMGGSKIETDKLGIDVNITSTQKCLGLPAGLSICSVSARAIEAAKGVKNRGSYFDLVKLYNYVHNKEHQYPSTPSLAHMFALDYQMDKILEEGLENRFKRHKEMANFLRRWAKKHFELFVEDEKYLSNTLTTIKNTRKIDIADLNKELERRGYMISNGYGDLKDLTFRISHMGDYTIEDLKGLIDNINSILELE